MEWKKEKRGKETSRREGIREDRTDKITGETYGLVRGGKIKRREKTMMQKRRQYDSKSKKERRGERHKSRVDKKLKWKGKRKGEWRRGKEQN